jgi:hypothetical protein
MPAAPNTAAPGSAGTPISAHPPDPLVEPPATLTVLSVADESTASAPATDASLARTEPASAPAPVVPPPPALPADVPVTPPGVLLAGATQEPMPTMMVLDGSPIPPADPEPSPPFAMQMPPASPQGWPSSLGRHCPGPTATHAPQSLVVVEPSTVVEHVAARHVPITPASQL